MAKSARPSSEQFIQLIEARETQDPAMPFIQRSVIKEGPKAYKLAGVCHRADSEGNVVRRELHLSCYEYRGGSGAIFEKPLAHWYCEEGEIERLRLFLEKVDAATCHGDHAIVKLDVATAFDEFLKALGNRPIEASQLVGVIRALAERSGEIQSLTILGEEDNRRMVSAALRASHRADALRRLRTLIAEKAVEARFQELLDQNWWMLGGQYVQMVPKREWTDRETLDILLRSADGYFDLVELKRSDARLFIEDHGRVVVSAEVNRAVSQVGHYLSEIEAKRDNLVRRFGIDLLKLKAKVVIGFIRDDDENRKLKRQALRICNSHLNRIEVITFDELVRIGEHIIAANKGESGQLDSQSDGVPPSV